MSFLFRNRTAPTLCFAVTAAPFSIGQVLDFSPTYNLLTVAIGRYTGCLTLLDCRCYLPNTTPNKPRQAYNSEPDNLIAQNPRKLIRTAKLFEISIPHDTHDALRPCHGVDKLSIVTFCIRERKAAGLRESDNGASVPCIRLAVTGMKMKLLFLIAFLIGSCINIMASSLSMPEGGLHRPMVGFHTRYTHQTLGIHSKLRRWSTVVEPFNSPHQ
ncbi:hypothetical protein F5Y04DRAFT_240916 [Hypomontagnella monticulosa]|nr:hypothetical protein F5Y04DRAFT_240916 [Hypomontagnella monticulosa]